MLHARDFVGQFGILACDIRRFCAVQCIASCFPRCRSLLEVFVHAVGNMEFLVFGPAVIALGQPDLFFAERLAVRAAGVLLVRRAP